MVIVWCNLDVKKQRVFTLTNLKTSRTPTLALITEKHVAESNRIESIITLDKILLNGLYLVVIWRECDKKEPTT